MPRARPGGVSQAGKRLCLCPRKLAAQQGQQGQQVPQGQVPGTLHTGPQDGQRTWALAERPHHITERGPSRPQVLAQAASVPLESALYWMNLKSRSYIPSKMYTGSLPQASSGVGTRARRLSRLHTLPLPTTIYTPCPPPLAKSPLSKY